MGHPLIDRPAKRGLSVVDGLLFKDGRPIPYMVLSEPEKAKARALLREYELFDAARTLAELAGVPF